MAERNDPPASESLRTSLSDADDRVSLNHWMPATRDFPAHPDRQPLDKYVLGAACRCSRAALPDRAGAEPARASRRGSLHPRSSCIAQSAPSVDAGFPWWLQVQHFLNMFFMLFIMRAGLQILADHPRLYWGRDCMPGSDWFRFQVPVPKGADMDCQGRFRHAARVTRHAALADDGAERRVTARSRVTPAVICILCAFCRFIGLLDRRPECV